MLSVRGGPPFDYRDNVNITSDKKKTSPLQYIPPVPEKFSLGVDREYNRKCVPVFFVI